MGEVSDEVIFQVFQVFQVLDGLLNDGDVIHNQLWGNEQVVLCVYKFPHWCWRKVDVEHLSLCLALNDGLYIEFSCLNPVFGVIHLGGHWIDEVSHLLRRVWIFKFHTLQATFVENANAPLWQSLRGIFTLQVFLDDQHCYGAVSRQETAEGGGFGFRNYVLQLSGLMKCLWTKPTFLEGRLSAKAVAPASSGRWFFNMFAVAKKTRRKSCKAAWAGSNMNYIDLSYTMMGTQMSHSISIQVKSVLEDASCDCFCLHGTGEVYDGIGIRHTYTCQNECRHSHHDSHQDSCH